MDKLRILKIYTSRRELDVEFHLDLHINRTAVIRVQHPSRAYFSSTIETEHFSIQYVAVRDALEVERLKGQKWNFVQYHGEILHGENRHGENRHKNEVLAVLYGCVVPAAPPTLPRSQATR